MQDLQNPEYQLPELPSALIKLALIDESKCFHDPRYEIDMFRWHSGKDSINPKLPCKVCFAGAVMAQHYDISPYDYVSAFNFSESDCNKFLALDSFRVGDVCMGVLSFYQDDETFKMPAFGKYYRSVPSYATHRIQWRAAMWEIARQLERAGF